MTPTTPTDPARPDHAGTDLSSPDRYWEQLPAGRGRLAGRAHLRSDAPELSLDGTWDVRFGRRADGSDLGQADGDAATSIEVPGIWQLQGHGAPQYTNVIYPIPLDVPHVPDENPTAEYERRVDVPDDWRERVAAGDRILLRFQGVDSCARVSIDGTEVGVTAGSRLSQEFDVTDLLAGEGPHVLTVRVHQWSVNTYLEDQDMWWASGIFRSVDLLLRPAGGIHDLVTTADYDPATGHGTLRADVTDPEGRPVAGRIRVLELGIDAPTGTDVDIPEVSPWSAESPRLYDASVSVGGAGDEDGSAVETVSLRLGFRRVQIDGEVLKVNGERVVFRGVNRHEVDSRVGRTQHLENQDLDVALMKRHNVNAVRTSHYPPHQRFLDLCDEAGLYVICEGDFEAHGFHADETGEDGAGKANRPADDPGFEETLVERTDRFMRRDRNHPSIVLWSIGNEASTGRTTDAMIAKVREIDTSRPVIYEQDYLGKNVDVYSLMYPSVAQSEEIGARGYDAARREQLVGELAHLGVTASEEDLATPPFLTKPFLWIEFAHAMGNGAGSLKEYMDLTERYPALQGGFIWEWIDHGLLTTDAEGREIYGYGGDFGDRVHDGNFVADGLVLPDRTPSPALLDMKHVYAPIALEIAEGALTVRNRRSFRDTADLRFEVSTDAQATWSELEVPPVAPGASADVSLPGAEGAPVVTVRATTRETEGPVPAGHLVVSDERVDTAAIAREVGARMPDGRADGADGADGAADAAGPSVDASGAITLGPAAFDALGNLLAIAGVRVQQAGVDLWRAPVDNERARTANPLEARWKRLNLDVPRLRTVSVQREDDALVVRRRFGLDGSSLGADVTERFTTDGRSLGIDVDVRPDEAWPADLPLPRIGWTAALEAAPRTVRWTGQGPHESYPDTGGGTTFATWTESIEDFQVPYVFPQENGNRAEVVEAEVGTAAGTLRVLAPEGLGLAVRPWSSAELDATAHNGSLSADGRTWITLSAALQGVGSAACGPAPLEQYVLAARPERFRFALAVD